MLSDVKALEESVIRVLQTRCHRLLTKWRLESKAAQRHNVTSFLFWSATVTTTDMYSRDKLFQQNTTCVLSAYETLYKTFGTCSLCHEHLFEWNTDVKWADVSPLLDKDFCQQAELVSLSFLARQWGSSTFLLFFFVDLIKCRHLTYSCLHCFHINVYSSP